MKLHWKILIWMAAGITVGFLLQKLLDGPIALGAKLEERDGGVVVAGLEGYGLGEKDKALGHPRFAVGDHLVGVILNRGREAQERRFPVSTVADVDSALREVSKGSVVWFEVAGAPKPRTATLPLDPDSRLARWVFWFDFAAQLFMKLLKMLIIPLVLTSIITGVAGLGTGRDFRRLGSKTFIYYIATSALAAATGLILVNLIRPGIGAELGLDRDVAFGEREESMVGIFLRMIPENIFGAFSENGNMLQVIFFAILFGYFVTKCEDKERQLLTDFFRAAFEVMMRLATFALALVPYGVFCLVVRVVAETGVGVFEPLLWYMLTVFLGLVIHSCISLPLIVRLIGRVSPRRWFQAMSPALLTAFSTSSSSMTLPVTMDCVEKRGGVSNRISSFVLPLGATVNMDGTAIYECVGVIFLAQYYMGDQLDLVMQLKVVILAMLASIGAAGIPSAGIVMMFTILSALELPLEGAALILAVDRPLDMCRTMTNIWSDSCGAATVARSEGEILFATEGPGGARNAAGQGVSGGEPPHEPAV
ncbi:MAG: dicarboxylate/amino acid:cation symporter [Planctomycetes bacterium]|nr:dicarboxylate/amino acid:cation symporter [Planctomycetota bacterium]